MGKLQAVEDKAREGREEFKKHIHTQNFLTNFEHTISEWEMDAFVQSWRHDLQSSL